MQRLLLIAGLFCCIRLAAAQAGLKLPEYGFLENPVITAEEDKRYRADGAVYLYYGQMQSYYIGEAGLATLECLHIAGKAYDNSVLEQLSTFVLPEVDGKDIVACRGRYIAPDGTILTLEKKDVKELDVYGRKSKALQFASSGVEGIIEFYYVIRRHSFNTQGSCVLPAHAPVKEFDFTLIYPTHLAFDVKTYNGLPPAEEKLHRTTDRNNDRTITFVRKCNVAKVPEEPFSFYRAHFPRLEYTLSYNHSTKKRLNTTEDYAEGLYRQMVTIPKSDVKTLKTMAAQAKVSKEMPVPEKIRAIESWLKSYFDYTASSSRQYADLTFCYANKVINTVGLMRAFYHLLSEAGVEFEFVLTSNKKVKEFDSGFDGTNFFREALIYFPETGQFTSVDGMHQRAGYLDFTTSGQNGMAFKPGVVNDTATFVTQIRYIPPTTIEADTDSMEIVLKPNPDKRVVTGHIRRSIFGDSGTPIQLHLADAPRSNIPEALSDYFLGLESESINVDNAMLYNNRLEDICVNPLVMRADIRDYYCLKEQGEDSLLLTVGIFIGKQAACEQETPRVLPLVCGAYRWCMKIEVDIPAGYTCLNYQELERAVYDEDNADEAQAAFIVETEQKGNQIIIRCEKFYARDSYPPHEFSKGQRVLGAATAFNDTVLIFTKQKH